MGDLKSADIFLLMRNPVLGYEDYGTNSCAKFQNALLANIQQTKQNTLCFALDPEFWWSSWFSYYERILRAAVCKYSNKSSKTYLEALKTLAGRLAILELAPYYSTDSDWLSSKANKLASTKKVKAAADDLKQRAREGNALVIVRWKAEMWGFQEADEIECPNNICLVSGRQGLGLVSDRIIRFLTLEK